MKLPSVNRYLLFGLFLFACLLALQYEFWYSQSGYFNLKTLKVDNAALNENDQRETLRNQLLEDEVLSLRSNDHVIEGMAREDLGLIMPGETYYQFVLPSVEINQN